MNEQKQVNVNDPAEGQSELNAGLGWQPIETAPEETLVIVGWLSKDDIDNPERHDFDFKEDGVWQAHDGLSQHAQAVAPRDIPCKMPSVDAPYTYWMYLPPIPGLPNAKVRGGALLRRPS